ncbi:hypothetical protein E2C01_056862 [Portunus trituberculatus]|uniref:Uncharacterized protein n=1 Tax=Portunus trituberculatus TaxID=210409 RepID=A0A5B7GVA6_PORTR|nr:hypothetical protein [Portunus trituberculatus]
MLYDSTSSGYSQRPSFLSTLALKLVSSLQQLPSAPYLKLYTYVLPTAPRLQIMLVELNLRRSFKCIFYVAAVS